MNNIISFFPPDIHTHVDVPGNQAIVNIEPGQPFGRSLLYSVGIHPWKADLDTLDQQLRLIDRGLEEYAWKGNADAPQFIAVGECGLDRRKGPDIDVQVHTLLPQLALAEKYSLPVILHIVGATDIILKLKKNLHTTVPWIIHGFRGNPRLAMQLHNAGFLLSLGDNHNTETATLPIPFLHESDRTIPREN